MKQNKTAVAITALAGTVLALSVWVSSQTVPLETDEQPTATEASVPAADGLKTDWLENDVASAAPAVSEPSTETSDGSATESAQLGEPSDVPQNEESSTDEPVRGTLGVLEETVSLTVVVTDVDGMPLENAGVLIGDLNGVTDQNGLFLASLPPQEAELMISLVGYVSHSEDVTLDGVAKKLVIQLEKADTIRKLLDSAELHPYRSNVPELNAYLDELYDELFEPNMDTYDKVKVCYDWLIEHMTYRNVSHQKPGYWNRAYQALESGKGTCYDYSVAFIAMMRHIGLDFYMLEGSTAASGGGMTGHYWPVVEIGGKYYIFDPQVEDSIAGRTHSKEITYQRFCLAEPNVKYYCSSRAHARCVESFGDYVNENGTFLDVSDTPLDEPAVDEPVLGDFNGSFGTVHGN